MKHSALVFALLFMALAFSACKQGASEQATAPLLPMKDFFRNPDRAYFRLSSDGKHVSFLQPYETRRNIHVVSRGESLDKAVRITSVTDRDLGEYFWKGPDHLIYFKDNGGDENFHLYIVDREGKASRDVTPYPNTQVSIVDPLIDDDAHVIIQMNKRNPQVFDVYRLAIATGKIELIAENPGNVTAWYTDHEGKLRAALTSEGTNQSLLFRDTEKQPFKSILTTTFKEILTPQFFTFDNKQLIVLSNRGRDKTAAFEFDPATAKETKLLYENAEVDIDGVGYSRKRKVIEAVYYTDWKGQQHMMDPQYEAQLNKLKAKLPGMEVVYQSWNKDENSFIVAAASDRTAGKRYLYDVATDSLQLLAELYPWLNPEDMSEMKAVSYQSRDGLTIHGYLTLPKGSTGKNLPVVINPHGGPWARDGWGFNQEVQFLANRGYAVLQMNFRGSTGYGREFWEKSFKQWGRTMQDDITDGVNWLVKEGIADPKRISIYGASYGGYATLSGVTRTPELYAAAVDYVGVANMFTFMNTIPPYWEPFRKQWYEMVGDPKADSLLLAEVSPVLHADKIKCPLLVAQGAKDPRVNKAESDQMVEALKKRGITVEYIVKDNEGHGFSNEENQFEFYRAMETFLAKHIGGRSETTTPPVDKPAPGGSH
jgi:dipeptidyl aminopeptidase/acylaminoacyl peptidase